MKERPVLFSSSMVLALLAGTKSQTRRVLKPQSETRPIGWGSHDVVGPRLPCPHGRPGDRLWVRETWGYRGSGRSNLKPKIKDVTIEYRADATRAEFVREADDDSGIPKQNVPAKFAGVRRASECNSDAEFDLSCEYGEWMTRWWKSWRPSIFMPRWASRITLEVTEVRVERLQDISEADAIAEGVLPTGNASKWIDDPRLAYRALWESINGAGSWDMNPWVWVVGFKRVKP